MKPICFPRRIPARLRFQIASTSMRRPRGDTSLPEQNGLREASPADALFDNSGEIVGVGEFSASRKPAPPHSPCRENQGTPDLQSRACDPVLLTHIGTGALFGDQAEGAPSLSFSSSFARFAVGNVHMRAEQGEADDPFHPVRSRLRRRSIECARRSAARSGIRQK